LLKTASRAISRLPAMALLLLCILMLCLPAAGERSNADNVWPETGQVTEVSGMMTVDHSHSDQGYIMVKASSKKKLKLRIICNETTYTYDLNGQDRYEVFPLQMGSGSYKIVLYENKSGKQYAQKATVTIKVRLSDENAAFLCPSQYVWYTQVMEAVNKSYELCANCTTDAERVDVILNYMRDYFMYDYVRSVQQKDAYLADIDGCYTNRKGLCMDLAAITSCMLRVQGIPCRMVVGEVANSYNTITHAWNIALIDGKEVRLDITAELMGSTGLTYTPDKIY